jgi:polyisoprenoid-binding protein YceI
MSFPRHLLPAFLVAASLVACNNSASDKPKASVSAPGAVTAASAGGTAYLIAPQSSKIEWTASKVTFTHEGAFGAFSGTVSLVDGAIEKSAVSIDIDPATITTSPEKLVAHLKSADFFDVAKFPKASFVSTSIKPGGEKGATHTVTGNLEIHGVTKAISFPATIALAGDAIDAKAVFTINRKDFSLNYPGKADDLIRDDVVVKLTVHATKKT